MAIGFITLALFVMFSPTIKGLTVSPITVPENAGTVPVTVTINAITPGDTLWLLVFDTVDGTAVAGTDYVALTSHATPPVLDGSLTTTIDVTISDNTGYQGPRSFVLRLSSESGTEETTPQEVTITIEDDETTPVDLSLTPSISTIKEGSGNLSVTLERQDGTTFPFDVTFTTAAGAGTATAVDDFQEYAGETISFALDEMSKVIDVIIVDDDLAEPSETFDVSVTGVGVLASVTKTVTIEDNDTPINFHCRRSGQSCASSSQCDFDNGSCDKVPCDPGFEGVDCKTETANVNTDCDPACVNGTCVLGDCHCNPGFAGPTCEEKAYFHHCNPENFSVCLTPYGAFQGQIYVQGYGNESACNLSVVAMPNTTGDGIVDWCVGYGAAIPYDGVCGTHGPIADGNDTKYEIVIQVQYNPPTLQGTDEIVTFTCAFNNDSIPVTGGGAVEFAPPQEAQGSPNGGTNDYSPATQTVTLFNGDPLPNPLPLDQQVKVCLSVEGVGGYESVIIRKIVLNNSRDDPDYMELVVYEDGCSLNNILFLTPYFDPDSLEHTMCYTFASFILDPTDPDPKLGIRTDVQVYGNAADAEADLDVCGARRKKREVTQTSHGARTEDGYSTSVIYLVPPTSGTANGGSGVADTNSDASTHVTTTVCGKEWLLPAMIGLGIVSVTMAVIITLLVCAVIKQNRTKNIE